MSTEETLKKCLTSDTKHFPAWYRYDKEGSRLNDLCLEKSSNYYFHRFETELLKTIVMDRKIFLENFRVLVDFGSGNAAKTKLFLDKFQKNATYVPVDISSDYLHEIVLQMQDDYKGKLKVYPMGMEYLDAFEHISKTDFDACKLYVWFGGILNLPLDDQVKYLSAFSRTLEESDRLLVTLDITDLSQKDEIVKAYSDEYARAMHLNAISRLNREYVGNIDTSLFDMRYAFVSHDSSDRCSYVKAWLEAKQKCSFVIEKLGLNLKFEIGEKLYLHQSGGVSSKYSLSQVRTLMRTASLDISDMWTNEHVAVVLLQAASRDNKTDFDACKLYVWFGGILNLSYDDQVKYLSAFSRNLEEKLGLNLEFEMGERLYLHQNGGLSSKYSLSQVRKLMRTASLDIADIWSNEHVAVVLLRSASRDRF